MVRVTAPDGFEAERYYDDGTRWWKVAARPSGSTWWTLCGFCGPAHAPPEDLDAEAKRVVAESVSLGMVK